MLTIAVGVTDAAHFEQRVELDGIVYVLTFHWNARMGLWTLDVGLPGVDVEPSVAGLTVVANRFLLARYHTIAGVPPGELLALDLSQLSDGPGFDWDNHTLCYFTAEEAATGVIA